MVENKHVVTSALSSVILGGVGAPSNAPTIDLPEGSDFSSTLRVPKVRTPQSPTSMPIKPDEALMQVGKMLGKTGIALYDKARKDANQTQVYELNVLLNQWDEKYVSDPETGLRKYKGTNALAAPDEIANQFSGDFSQWTEGKNDEVRKRGLILLEGYRHNLTTSIDKYVNNEANKAWESSNAAARISNNEIAKKHPERAPSALAKNQALNEAWGARYGLKPDSPEVKLRNQADKDNIYPGIISGFISAGNTKGAVIAFEGSEDQMSADVASEVRKIVRNNHNVQEGTKDAQSLIKQFDPGKYTNLRFDITKVREEAVKLAGDDPQRLNVIMTQFNAFETEYYSSRHSERVALTEQLSTEFAEHKSLLKLTQSETYQDLPAKQQREQLVYYRRIQRENPVFIASQGMTAAELLRDVDLKRRIKSGDPTAKAEMQALLKEEKISVAGHNAIMSTKYDPLHLNQATSYIKAMRGKELLLADLEFLQKHTWLGPTKDERTMQRYQMANAMIEYAIEWDSKNPTGNVYEHIKDIIGQETDKKRATLQKIFIGQLDTAQLEKSVVQELTPVQQTDATRVNVSASALNNADKIRAYYGGLKNNGRDTNTALIAVQNHFKITANEARKLVGLPVNVPTVEENVEAEAEFFEEGLL